MKIIKAVHLNGTDKKKRYWKIPPHLEFVRISNGDQAAVETQNGPMRVKIVGATIISDEGWFVWNNKHKGRKGRLTVTQEVIMFFDKKTGKPKMTVDEVLKARIEARKALQKQEAEEKAKDV